MTFPTASHESPLKRIFTFLGWPLLLVPQLIFWTGALLNQIAIAANHGLMPVYMPACEYGVESGIIDARHICMTSAMHFKFLSDWINVGDILSPGDVLLGMGDMLIIPAFWMWIAYVMWSLYECWDNRGLLDRL